ncbi:geranylgeranyl diphosphate synthase type II [Ereboglobus sp. PH5-5]|uniref:polyprenyl synthetase family protein n=1 Tax=Ereboglobus sp. PH5-5 TaxID=2940529 RepID=UPI002405CA07|nr:farnesyl diphosphate synthase [Ereboglobus sp. PH5-5]MDF9832712.1 geranylgeranyl diphosphate synthase type II [Ereboglobus sp. PH5-5]
MDFTTKLNTHIARVEQAIDGLLPAAAARPSRLHEAMRYGMQAGGKRLRPVLLLAAADLRGNPLHDPAAAAVAVECIHTYSLLHDDLPCMDNDDMRRGRPTAHKHYDEATALLAGDALLTHAFLLLATHYSADAELSRALVRELAAAAGSEQLIGGQMEDLLAEKKVDATGEQLEYIHLNKTAAMIRASLVMGGMCGGLLSESELDALRELGRELGHAFQVVDDILDSTADSATLGKTVGKDAKSGKTTYVRLYGIEGARRHAETHTQAALAALAQLPGDTTFLRDLITSMLDRRK